MCVFHVAMSWGDVVLACLKRRLSGLPPLGGSRTSHRSLCVLCHYLWCVVVSMDEFLGLREVDYLVIEKGTGLRSAFISAEV